MSIDERKTIEKLLIIAEHKAMEVHAQKEQNRKIEQDYKDRGDTEGAKFWEEASDRLLSKWSAYNDMAESIKLYLK